MKNNNLGKAVEAHQKFSNTHECGCENISDIFLYIFSIFIIIVILIKNCIN
jgi:hypothetical protein